jgi:hypothetical protein
LTNSCSTEKRNEHEYMLLSCIDFYPCLIYPNKGASFVGWAKRNLELLRLVSVQHLDSIQVRTSLPHSWVNILLIQPSRVSGWVFLHSRISGADECLWFWMMRTTFVEPLFTAFSSMGTSPILSKACYPFLLVKLEESIHILD